MATGWTQKGFDLLGRGDLDMLNDTLELLLVKSGHSLSNLHNFAADVAGDEADFTNYVRKALASRAWTRDDGNNRLEFDCADIEYTSAGGTTDNTVVGGYIRQDVTNDSDSPVIAHVDFANILTDGSTFTITIAGLLRLQHTT